MKKQVSRTLTVCSAIACALVVAPISAPAAPRAHRDDQRARFDHRAFQAPTGERGRGEGGRHGDGQEPGGGEGQGTGGQLLWDRDPAVEQRVAQILARMTNAEKADLATGQINNAYGFYNNPIPSVGIPAQTMADGPVGVRIANPAADRRATAMPSGTAMAASFNQQLWREIGQTLGNEAFHTGHNVLLAPSVDIARTPLWGRAFEGFGEDPLLNGLAGARYIAGVQTEAVAATIKHFIVYDQETNRFTVDAQVDDRTLHEIYGRPFEIGVREGRPGAAMCAFNKVNGVFACENPLMNTLLKGQYDFRGFVMSDYNATPSTAAAANAGLDQEQPGDQGPGSANFGERLIAAVNAGQVSQARLDDMARRILRPMVGLGLLDRPVQTDRFDEQQHGQVARRVAQQGIVLLKNDSSALPLRRRLRSIAVIGPDADNTSARGGGSAAMSRPTYEVSPLAGIESRAGGGVDVRYAPGTDGINEADMLPGPAPVPASVLRPNGTPGERGLHAQYFAGSTFAGTPLRDAVDPNVNVNFGFVSFPGFNAASPKAPQSRAVEALAEGGNFGLVGDLSARWTGTLVAPATAAYQLGLTARGDARLFLDGNLLVSHTGPLSSVSQTVHMNRRDRHTIRIEYSAPAESMYQGGQVRFFWQHPENVMAPAMRRAVRQARRADAAVVVVRDYESEGGDRANLDLPREQDQLIRRVAAANPYTVVVITTGAPSKTSTWEQNVPAILQAWYPGQEQGNAIADVLFGDVNPSGKLPATVPVDETQVPPIDPDLVAEHPEGIFVGYRGFQQRGLTPSYPFGHGLSYTRFGYGGLTVGRGGRQAGHRNRGNRDAQRSDVQVSFTLTNRGRRAGAEVAQAYIGRLPGSVVTPPRQLAGFERVELGPRQSRRVTISISRESLSYWDSATQQWVTPSGDVSVYVGGSSADTPLSGVISLR